MDLSGATGKVNLLLVATLLLIITATAQAFSFCFSFGGGGGSRGNAGLYNYPLPPPGFAPGGYVPYAYSPAAPDLLYDYYPPVLQVEEEAPEPAKPPRPTLGWPR